MCSTPASLGMSLRRVLDRLAAIDAELRLRGELERLDERTLRDVGLTRAQIEAEIRRLPRLGGRHMFAGPATAGRMSAGDPVSGEARKPTIRIRSG